MFLMLKIKINNFLFINLSINYIKPLKLFKTNVLDQETFYHFIDECIMVEQFIQISQVLIKKSTCISYGWANFSLLFSYFSSDYYLLTQAVCSQLVSVILLYLLMIGEGSWHSLNTSAMNAVFYINRLPSGKLTSTFLKNSLF